MCFVFFFLMTKKHRFPIFLFHQQGEIKLNISYTLSDNDLSNLQHINWFSLPLNYLSKFFMFIICPTSKNLHFYYNQRWFQKKSKLLKIIGFRKIYGKESEWNQVSTSENLGSFIYLKTR